MNTLLRLLGLSALMKFENHTLGFFDDDCFAQHPEAALPNPSTRIVSTHPSTSTFVSPSYPYVVSNALDA